MSGPIASFDEQCENDSFVRAEAREGRRAEVGGLPVARVLPTKGRRTVGAWCFVDLAGPAEAEEPDPLEVGPHPHIGLATVTWLLEGEALHSDSLGTEQIIRPGQLNLMTAGHGIAHAELAAQPPFRAVQMWIAQPERTRHGEAWFEHHGELPQFDLPNGSGMVFVGTSSGVTSPATTDSALVGIDLKLRRGVAEIAATASFEHAVVPLDGKIKVGDDIVEPGWIGLIPCGHETLPIEAASDDTRLLLLGGEPLGERVEMWWNFVARDRQEIETAYRDWEQHSDRFPQVPSKLGRIDAPKPPWMRVD